MPNIYEDKMWNIMTRIHSIQKNSRHTKCTRMTWWNYEIHKQGCTYIFQSGSHESNCRFGLMLTLRVVWPIKYTIKKNNSNDSYYCTLFRCKLKGDCALTANEYAELLYPCSAFVISDVHVHLSTMYVHHCAAGQDGRSWQRQRDEWGTSLLYSC